MKHTQIPLVTLHESPPLPGNGKFHVKLIEGVYQNLRRLVSWPLLGLFFILVWVRINGQPLIMFDVNAHRIFLFGAELSWYDLPILAGMMICGASLLFFMAVGWGRVWCGFACPQSIWTWLFIRIEEMVEGRAAKRAQLEQGSLRSLTLVKRMVKHSLWLLLSFATALTFSSYFVPIDLLIADLIQLDLSLFGLSWLIIMSLLTYANAGLVREKVCLHMCPYSRFQGVMFDDKTYTVTYDRARGEPRSHLRGKDETQGDCVDCSICVQVCPTGIDIRDGLQAACIDCAACIDACDTVMVKLGKETGLIGFYSEQSLTDRAPKNNRFTPRVKTILRPRLLGYFCIFITTLLAVSYALQTKTELIIEVARDRGALYQIINGHVCNHYQIELEAFSPQLTQLSIAVDSSLPLGTLALIGPEHIDLFDQNTSTHYTVCAPNAQLPSKMDIAFTFTSGAFSASKNSTFLAPY
ncbi:MAG: iron-sulfur protein [Neptuniibacter sp. Phe_28]|nr:MAG: iron-sulfur protein [Neptuniibacter sp. Phe_28]